MRAYLRTCLAVSNPIREYLQIEVVNHLEYITKTCFKPYKGVSSNKKMQVTVGYEWDSFKPYKGVSSNI